MQIFEYYFNPKNEEGKIFKTFAHEPKNSYEKRMGSLYIAGEVKNDNSNLIERLAKEIKEKYYRSNSSPQESLPETLKRANQFLSEEVKKENVKWLGSLNYGIFSLKNLDLNFTKTGNLKVLLIRSGKITDIGKNLEKKEIDPYPLKVFFDVASGKLLSNDILVILSEEVYSFLKEKGILDKFSDLEDYSEKAIRKIFPKDLFTKESSPKISGLCFLLFFNSDSSRPKEVMFQEKIKAAASPPKVYFKKNHVIVSLLVFILFLGFLFFNKEKTKEASPVIEKEEELFHLENTKERELSPALNTKENAEKLLILSENDIFYYSPEEAFYKEEEITLPYNFISATALNNTVFFLTPSGDLFSLKEDKKIRIGENFNLLNSYGSNLYFTDTKNCSIMKYSPDLQKKTEWIKEKKPNQTCLSITIDGSIWILNKENSLDLYHKGEYQRSIDIPEGVTSVGTRFNEPNLYLAYPAGERIIIINKEGDLVKQIKNSDFKELKDIFISKDNIWVLSGNNVYKIKKDG